MMNYSRSSFFFFTFYLPLFAIKFLNITSDNIILVVLGVFSFLIIFAWLVSQKYTYFQFRLFAPLLLFSALSVLTSGKQAFLFTVLMIMAMKDMSLDDKIIKVCYKVAIPCFIVTLILTRNGFETERYINGEWVTIVKRGNILFVNYTALAVLYLLKRRKNIEGVNLFKILLISVFMSYWSGSRTGLLSMLILLSLLWIFKRRGFVENRILKYVCVYSPLYCMLLCFISAIMFNDSPVLLVADMFLQGRLGQNNMFYDRYGVTMFGNHIFEGIDSSGDFWNLDCAYMDFIICEGLVFSILWIVTTIAVIKYYYSHKKMVEVAILVMYSFYGISETFLPNCFLNMSLFLYGEYIYEHLLSRHNKRIENDTKKNSLLLVE